MHAYVHGVDIDGHACICMTMHVYDGCAYAEFIRVYMHVHVYVFYSCAFVNLSAHVHVHSIDRAYACKPIDVSITNSCRHHACARISQSSSRARARIVMYTRRTRTRPSPACDWSVIVPWPACIYVIILSACVRIHVAMHRYSGRALNSRPTGLGPTACGRGSRRRAQRRGPAAARAGPPPCPRRLAPRSGSSLRSPRG